MFFPYSALLYNYCIGKNLSLSVAEIVKLYRDELSARQIIKV